MTENAAARLVTEKKSLNIIIVSMTVYLATLIGCLSAKVSIQV